MVARTQHGNGRSAPPQSPSLTLNHFLSLQFSIDQDQQAAARRPPSRAAAAPTARPRAARAPALSPRAAAARPRPPAAAASGRRRPRPWPAQIYSGRRCRRHPTSPPLVLPLLCSAPGRQPPPPCCRAPGHGTARRRRCRAVPGPGCWHGGTTRHGTAAPPCPGVPCPVVPCFSVLVPVPCRAARLASYTRS